MSKKYPTKSLCVCDNGLFLELAIKLSKDFGKVMYWSPWVSPFPKSNQQLIGEGVPGIERINNLFDHIEDADAFLFPDVYDGDLQLHLEGLGKRVFGSRKGEELEIERDASKRYFKKIGLPVGKWYEIIGLDNLRKHLKEHDEQWIKCNGLRGNFETFFSKNYKFIEPKLDELEHNLGAMKKILKFIVEDNLDGCVEVGYDGFCIDGQYPDKCIAGIEVKNLGFAGYVRDYADLPGEITGFNDKISEAMRNYRYRNFLSTEIRVGKDHIPYMIDCCNRAGSPPSELYQNMIDNLAEIIWEGSDGNLVQPKYNAKCGVEVMIHSEWADKNWQAVQFPEKYRDNVKLRNLTIINGEYYVVPQNVGLPEIGSVVATGDTLEEASKKVMEICEEVTGYYLTLPTESIGKAQAGFDKLEEMGIKI